MGVLPVYMSMHHLHAVTTAARRMCHIAGIGVKTPGLMQKLTV